MADEPSYRMEAYPEGQDAISIGRQEGSYVLNKFAYRSDIDTVDGDALIIADNTTNTPTILTSPSTFTIAYTNTSDGEGQNGALSLLVTYLDDDEDEVTAIHTLGSSGSDVTSFTGLGINRVVVLSSGSSSQNVADITVTATAGGSVQAFVPAGDSVTEQLIFHTPRNIKPLNKVLFLNAQKLSGGSAPRVTFKIKVHSRITNTTYELFRYIMDTSIENSLVLIDPCNFPFSPRDVVYITASTDTNNAAASARMSMNMHRV